MIQDSNSIFLSNLKVLGFDQGIHIKDSRIKIDKDVFLESADNTRAFEIISYFLFCQLDKPKAKSLFNYCWPTNNSKEKSSIYKHVALDWLQQLKNESKLFQGVQLRMSNLRNCRGEIMNEIFMAFSTLVLEKVTTRKKIDIIPFKKATKATLQQELQRLAQQFEEKEEEYNQAKALWNQQAQSISSQLSRQEEPVSANTPKHPSQSVFNNEMVTRAMSHTYIRLEKTVEKIRHKEFDQVERQIKEKWERQQEAERMETERKEQEAAEQRQKEIEAAEQKQKQRELQRQQRLQKEAKERQERDRLQREAEEQRERLRRENEERKERERQEQLQRETEIQRERDRLQSEEKELKQRIEVEALREQERLQRIEAERLERQQRQFEYQQQVQRQEHLERERETQEQLERERQLQEQLKREHQAEIHRIKQERQAEMQCIEVERIEQADIAHRLELDNEEKESERREAMEKEHHHRHQERQQQVKRKERISNSLSTQYTKTNLTLCKPHRSSDTYKRLLDIMNQPAPTTVDPLYFLPPLCLTRTPLQDVNQAVTQSASSIRTSPSVLHLGLTTGENSTSIDLFTPPPVKRRMSIEEDGALPNNKRFSPDRPVPHRALNYTSPAASTRISVTPHRDISATLQAHRDVLLSPKTTPQRLSSSLRASSPRALLSPNLRKTPHREISVSSPLRTTIYQDGLPPTVSPYGSTATTAAFLSPVRPTNYQHTNGSAAAAAAMHPAEQSPSPATSKATTLYNPILLSPVRPTISSYLMASPSRQKKASPLITSTTRTSATEIRYSPLRNARGRTIFTAEDDEDEYYLNSIQSVQPLEMEQPPSTLFHTTPNRSTTNQFYHQAMATPAFDLYRYTPSGSSLN